MLDLGMFKNPKKQREFEKEYKKSARLYPMEDDKSLQARIFNLFSGDKQYSLKQMQSMLKKKFGSEQIRKLRQPHFGKHKVDCIRTDEDGTTKYVYKLTPNPKVMAKRKSIKQMLDRRKKNLDKFLKS